MPIMEISIVPIGTKKASISKYVASSDSVLRCAKGLKFQITAMGTIVEADSLEKLLAVALQMHREAFAHGVKRVLTDIKIDERLDKKSSIASKVASVMKKIKKGCCA